MNHFLHNLLTGLTTVFAWTPATILLIMPFIGIYTGLLYVSEMDTFLEIARLVLLCFAAVLGIAGYLGLSAICWGLKLPIKAKLPCLLCGIAALASVIGIGYMSNNPLLHLRFTVEHMYLFVSPLVFLVLHSALEFKKRR